MAVVNMQFHYGPFSIGFIWNCIFFSSISPWVCRNSCIWWVQEVHGHIQKSFCWLINSCLGAANYGNHPAPNYMYGLKGTSLRTGISANPTSIWNPCKYWSLTYQRGPCKENSSLFLDNNTFICHGRNVRSTRCAAAHDNSNLIRIIKTKPLNECISLHIL